MIGIFVESYDIVPEASEKNGDLDGPAGYQVVEANGAPRVILQEDHQEPEAHKDHNMNVLEEWVF